MEVASYEDPILKLARDPDLNREKNKTSQLIQIIHNFPLTERRISKLCQLSLTILQSLEKIELNSKNWHFLSLDINSDTHFNQDTEEEDNSVLRKFNNDIASKVLLSCQDFQKKLHRISQDLDFITRSSRSLSPLEFLSDSGTLLTQLTLRNIKLKDDLADKITVAYSRAKLINIGTDLEEMLDNGDSESNDEDDQTILTYKSFVVSLLKQLNNSIEEEDLQAKYECLAVISDMEKMFEAFKIDKLQEAAELAEREREDIQKEMDRQSESKHKERISKGLPEEGFVYIESPTNTSPQSDYKFSPNVEDPVHERDDNESSGNDQFMDEEYDSDMASSSMFSSSVYQPPLIHSITRSNNHSAHHSPQSSNTGLSIPRRDSMSSYAGSTILHKTTIAEEMPYLMSAFDSARNFEEDVSHYMDPKEKQELEKKRKSAAGSSASTSPSSSIGDNASANSTSGTSNKTRSTSPSSSNSNLASSLHMPTHFSQMSSKLPSSNPLYAESSGIKNIPSPASSYLYSNNSLLSKLGIKPQVITADLPSRGSQTLISPPMSSNTSANRGFLSQSFHGALPGKENKTKREEDEEKQRAKKNMISSMPSLPAPTIPLTSANLASLTQHGEVD